jgi:hypothetical protein
MATRIATGNKVIVLSNAEYRTMMQALEFTRLGTNRGNVSDRCRKLLAALEA